MIARTLLASLILTGSLFAAPITYYTTLSGAAEAPPNASPGTGSTTLIFDLAANTFRVIADFSGLLGTVTASHIHCCTAVPGTGTAGVATITPTFTGFPSGVTSGTYDRTFDMTIAGTFNTAFVTANGGTFAGAAQALADGLAQGRAYMNIHTTVVAAGEIRGFLAEVPEPGTFALIGTALAFAGLARRRRS